MPPVTTTDFHSLALFLFLFFSSSTTSNAHNITRILAKHPEFSTFNHYLTTTHLAAEINRRQTITVLALENAAMSSLLAKQLSLYTLKNVLSLHVLVDYFGSKKLHQITNGTALTGTMFQATGAAPGSSGYINVTDFKGGKVGFGPEDNDGKLDAVYVKSVAEIPYNISVLQISQVLNSAEAEAPTAEPSQLNLTEIMSKQGCKAFADLMKASGADATFNQNIDGDGANKYDFTIQNDGEVVTLKTNVMTAKITGTLKDEEPLIVYKINRVLLPRELFKPEETAEAPKPSKSKHKAAADAPESDAPAESDPADDQTADNENRVAGLMDGRRLVIVLLSLCIGVLLM
ncbi:hypothetical protein REPUB_Repub17cG0035900 [Reevesia pubescens]